MPTAKLSPSPDRAARTIATCPTIKSDVIQTLRLKKEIIDQIHWCEHKLAVVIRIYKWTPKPPNPGKPPVNPRLKGRKKGLNWPHRKALKRRFGY